MIKATRHAESTWFFEALEPWTPSDDVLGERDVSNSGDNTGNARWESHENASWKWYPKGLERDIESMYEDEQPGGVFADMGMAGLGGAHKMYTPGDPEASCKYLGKRPGHVYLKTAAEARAHCQRAGANTSLSTRRLTIDDLFDCDLCTGARRRVRTCPPPDTRSWDVLWLLAMEPMDHLEEALTFSSWLWLLVLRPQRIRKAPFIGRTR